MRTRFLLLVTPVFIFFITAKANAQTDTTQYDLGRMQVKKDFTQSITIKGSDLEKYPFSDLSDALQVWFYGTFTNSTSVVYVVDGNIINDVNAYNIHDIEEVTLVQSALAQVSGATPAQQLILIKTRRHRPGKQGIEVDGQTNIVDQRNKANTPNVNTTHDVYDQYYITGYKNFDNTSVGVSVDYQHDVVPTLTSNLDKIYDPFEFDCFKINAWADTKLWAGSTLALGVNYVPQITKSSYDFDSPVAEAGSTNETDFADHISQHLFNSTLTLNSHIVKGLTNTLSAAYNHTNFFQGELYDNNFTSTSEPSYELLEAVKGYDKNSTLLLRDNLIYHMQAGNFGIDPAMNFTYRKVRDTSYFGYTEYENESGNNFPPGPSTGFSGSSTNYKVYLLTPSVDIYYKDIINIQGGVVTDLNSAKDFSTNYQKHRVFPFITASADIAKLASLNDISLRVYASAARHNGLLDDSYTQLQGFNSTGLVSANASFINSNGAPYGYANFDPYQDYNIYQAGVVLGLGKNFNLNYSMEYRYYMSYFEAAVPLAPNNEEYELFPYDDKIITNRLGLGYNYHAGSFNWAIGLNATESKLGVVSNSSNSFYATSQSTYLSAGHRWTGGFTNRFSFSNFFAGLDVLYQLGERPYSLENYVAGADGYVAATNNNSFSLQNLYVGTKITIPHVKYAEFYLNGCNIWQNKSSDITDERRFYGFGFKLNL